MNENDTRTDDQKITDLADGITDLIFIAQVLNASDAPTRSRELSLAITKLQEASHWIWELEPHTQEQP
jgi:hypothetical protein